MAFRSIILANGAKVSVKNEQLVIAGDTEHSVPLEDIRTLVVENRSVLLTAYALSALSLHGVCVYFCDEKHLPCSVLLPFAQYSRKRKQLMAQLEQSKPTVKRLWQQIITAKIRNQAKCLSLCCPQKRETAEKLERLAGQVRSGDPDNLEAQAAAAYFPALFGSGFARSHEEDVPNGALNYGYAIVRGYIARKLAEYGFEPCLGLHHCSELNPYNLADDLLEPFRPLVDWFVFCRLPEGEEGLPAALKHELANVMNYEVVSGGERHSAAYGVERMIHSLERAFEEEGKENLCLPSLEELRRHEYE